MGGAAALGGERSAGKSVHRSRRGAGRGTRARDSRTLWSGPQRDSCPGGINYFHVQLKDGQRWRYAPPEGHTVAWLAVDKGDFRSPEPIGEGQLAVFEESGSAIELEAHGDTSFVLGSAIKHPHPLVLGYYSVHTSSATLAQGEAEIDRIGAQLRAAGRL